RARTSASLLPAVWPTYSKRNGTVTVFTSATDTGAGGNPPPPPCAWPRPQAATTRVNSNTAATRGRFAGGAAKPVAGHKRSRFIGIVRASAARYGWMVVCGLRELREARFSLAPLSE